MRKTFQSNKSAVQSEDSCLSVSTRGTIRVARSVTVRTASKVWPLRVHGWRPTTQSIEMDCHLQTGSGNGCKLPEDPLRLALTRWKTWPRLYQFLSQLLHVAELEFASKLIVGLAKAPMAMQNISMLLQKHLPNAGAGNKNTIVHP